MSQFSAYISHLENDNYLEVIRHGLEWVNAKEWIKPDTKVFIKPNLTFPVYRPGVMTSPRALEAAILAINDYTHHIHVGDSDSGGYNRFSMDQVYRETGIIDFAAKHGIKVVNLSNELRRPIHFEYKGKSFSLDLPCLLTDETDITITVPVPKVHCNSGVSLTFKNQWGCIPENKDRLRLHPYFKHVILEVNRAINAKMAIIDGTYGLNVNGPLRGRPVRLDWLLVSNDLGTGARIACDLMQIKLETIRHLRYAKKLGLIPEYPDISINQDLELFKTVKFHLKRELTDIPGVLAFNNPFFAYLAYFSPIAGLLHKILYWFREPFYDYSKNKI